MRERMKGFLLSTPNSSRTLLIYSGSMVPEPSSSKTLKVSSRSAKSSGRILSFQDEGLLETAGAGALTFDLALLMDRDYKIKINLKIQLTQSISNPPHQYFLNFPQINFPDEYLQLLYVSLNLYSLHNNEEKINKKADQSLRLYSNQTSK